MLDTKTKPVSGSKMIFGTPGLPDNIKERYERENLNEEIKR
jgi:hypothetical protein